MTNDLTSLECKQTLCDMYSYKEVICKEDLFDELICDMFLRGGTKRQKIRVKTTLNCQTDRGKQNMQEK